MVAAQSCGTERLAVELNEGMTTRLIDGYDVIGDVHGHVHAVEGLLAQMGYSCLDGVWSHPTRRAVFVGDLIDRGAAQVATVRLVQSMITAGSALAVIGNHEYNAVAWTVERPDQPGVFCRSHDEHHLAQHREFLDQVSEGSDLHHELVDWFCTLPLWLELELDGRRLRVVHACWQQELIDLLTPLLSAQGTLTHEAVQRTSQRGTPEYEALEVVLKGPEVPLGAGRRYAIVEVDQSGLPKPRKWRKKARQRWWDAEATTLDRACIIPSGAANDPDTWADFPVLPPDPVDSVGVYTASTPVVVGHYWTPASDPLEPRSERVVCVDFSAAKNGPLVAYRWQGEQVLVAEHMVAHHFHHPSPDDVAGAQPDDD